MGKVIGAASFLATLALAVTWLLLAERSPAHEWLLTHPFVANVARFANSPAFVAAAIGSGNVHAPGTVWVVGAIAVQWFLVGVLLAVACSKIRR